MGVVTLRPALTDRLALAAVVGSLATSALTSAGLVALRSTRIVFSRRAFRPASFSGFRGAPLRHSFATRTSRSTLRHPTSRGTRGDSLPPPSPICTATAQSLRGRYTHAGHQRCRSDQKAALNSNHLAPPSYDCSHEATAIQHVLRNVEAIVENLVVLRSFRRRLERREDSAVPVSPGYTAGALGYGLRGIAVCIAESV